jgi:hypothetical protein
MMPRRTFATKCQKSASRAALQEQIGGEKIARRCARIAAGCVSGSRLREEGR